MIRSRSTVLVVAVVVGLTAWLLVPRSEARGHDNHADGHPLVTGDVHRIFQTLSAGPVAGTSAVHHRGSARPAEHVEGEKVRGRMFRTGHMAFEPTVGLDRDGRLFTLGLVDVGGGIVQTAVLRSDDQGRTFTEITPTIGPARAEGRTLDPFLHVDRTTGRVFSADLTLINCSIVSYTDDAGGTWGTGKACDLTDHQNVFTGPPVTSTTDGYPNLVYYCAIDLGASVAGQATSCLKSTDGGRTFLRTGPPAYTNEPGGPGGSAGIPGYYGGGTGHGMATPDGTIYLPRGFRRQPYVAISADEGASWELVQVADNGIAYDPNQMLESHDTGVAVDAAGRLHYLWIASDRLPYIATSGDGGRTWSEPVMVAPPDVVETSMPAIDAGDAGHIAIAYLGSTNAPGGDPPPASGSSYEGVTWNGYLTITDSSGSPDPIFTSVTVNDPADPLVRGECGVIRCQQQFDFIDVEIGPDGQPWTSMVDGCPDGTEDCPPMGIGIVGTIEPLNDRDTSPRQGGRPDAPRRPSGSSGPATPATGGGILPIGAALLISLVVATQRRRSPGREGEDPTRSNSSR